MAQADWIAVDWGTTRVRLWPMAGDAPMDRIDSDQGMSALAPGEFEDALLDLCARWIDGPTEVLICGMAGARQGWMEAPYVKVPSAPPTDGIAVKASDPRLSVRILPGMSQESPADVMRGEETQIGGYLAENPAFDGVLCLPGTHTKWAHISAQEVVSFRTFMTGELFHLLSQQSVLRHSVSDGWEDAAFDAGIADAMRRPAAMAAELFSLRADSLLNDTAPGPSRARLSGLLIGMELAAARPYWLGQDIVILGEDALAKAYETGLAAQSATVRRVPVEGATLAGLIAARHATRSGK